MDQRTPDPVDAFLAAAQWEDANSAREILESHPALPGRSLHVAAVLGRIDDARRLIAGDATRVTTRAGDPPAEPLVFLCFSPFHGESAERDAGLLETARLLLASGADPNATGSRFGVPALFAVTGMHNVLPIATLLLDSGANPTDGESVFHAAERFHEDALELLLSRGAELNATGDWGNTPLSFLLRWWDLEKSEKVAKGVAWLLEHGADPNVRSGEDQETALHVAIRRGQSIRVLELLLAHDADVNARRGDGATVWRVARRGGFDDVAAFLERAGARTESLSPLDLLLSACGRGDVDAAGRLSSPELLEQMNASDRLLMIEAAGAGRFSTVAACLAAGFAVDATDSTGATALHHSAIIGNVRQVRLLLDARADIAIRDREHSATPVGWAEFGEVHFADPAGDYKECIRALVDAGAQWSVSP